MIQTNSSEEAFPCISKPDIDLDFETGQTVVYEEVAAAAKRTGKSECVCRNAKQCKTVSLTIKKRTSAFSPTFANP